MYAACLKARQKAELELGMKKILETFISVVPLPTFSTQHILPVRLCTADCIVNSDCISRSICDVDDSRLQPLVHFSYQIYHSWLRCVASITSSV